jgi:hypothetical protein
MKTEKRNRNQKKGAYSVLVVILLLAMTTVFSGYVGILKQTLVLNDVQQKMDTAGLSALNSSVDVEKLSQEVLAIKGSSYAGKDQQTSQVLNRYKEDITKEFKSELNEMLAGNNGIVRHQYLNTTVNFAESSWGIATGDDSTATKALPQITLDNVMTITLDANSMPTEQSIKELNAKKSINGTTVHYKINGLDKEGNVILLAESSTRVVYR